MGMGANLIERGAILAAACAYTFNIRFRVPNQIPHPAVQHSSDNLIELQLLGGVWIEDLDFSRQFVEQWYAFSDLIEREQVGFVSIVEVGSVVGEFVSRVNQLRFEGRAFVEQVFGKLRKLSRVIVAGVLNDAFANFKRKIQATKSCVAQLEIL